MITSIIKRKLLEKSGQNGEELVFLCYFLNIVLLAIIAHKNFIWVIPIMIVVALLIAIPIFIYDCIMDKRSLELNAHDDDDNDDKNDNSKDCCGNDNNDNDKAENVVDCSNANSNDDGQETII